MSPSQPDRFPPALPTAALAELNELLWALPSSLDPHEIVSVLLERCTRLFDAPLAAMWTHDKGAYELAGCFGFTEKKAEQLWQRLELAERGAQPLQLDGAALHALGGFGKRRLGSLLAVPLSTPRGLLGWLVFARLEPRAFSDLERSFVGILANRVAGSLENARQYQESQTRAAELELLNEIAELLVSTTRLDELLARLVTRMVETLALSWCFVYLVEGRGPLLKPRAIYHRDPEQIASLREFLETRPLRTDQGRSAEIFQRQAPVLVTNLAEDPVVPADIRERLGPGSLVVVPLASRGEFLGAMYLVRGTRGAALGHDVLPLATHLANQVSVAIANARLYEDLEAKVAERTDHLQGVYEELARRFVSGKAFFQQLSGDLRADLDALEAAHARLADALAGTPPDAAGAREALVVARAVAARLEAADRHIVERLERGERLPPFEPGTGG